MIIMDIILSSNIDTMGYKNTKGKKGKKNYKRKNNDVQKTRKGEPLIVYASPAGVVPSKILHKSTYYENALNSGTGIVSYNYQFRSSANDPNFTLGIGSHQPYGYDQFATLYNRTRVMKMVFTVRFTNNEAFQPVVVAMYNSPDSGIPTGLQILEQPGNQKKLIGSAGGVNTATIKRTVYPWIVLGKTKEEYLNDENVVASIAGNPAEMAYTGILILAQNTNLASGVNFTVELDMWIQYESPLIVATS